MADDIADQLELAGINSELELWKQIRILGVSD